MVVEGAEEAFAEAELGSLYIWSKNTSMALNVSCFTSPIGTFQGAYQSGGSGGDQSLASFKIQGELYFLTVGFSKWDGYSVFNDPTFNSRIGASEHLFTPGSGIFPETFNLGFIIGGGIILGVVFVVVIIKKKGRGKSFKVEPTF
jgi:hypothetical protein